MTRCICIIRIKRKQTLASIGRKKILIETVRLHCFFRKQSQSDNLQKNEIDLNWPLHSKSAHWQIDWVAISEFDGMQFGTKTKLCGQSIKLLTFPSQKCRAVTKCPRIGDLCTSYDRNNSLNGNQCTSNCKRIFLSALMNLYIRLIYKAKSITWKCKNLLRKQFGHTQSVLRSFLTSCAVSNSSFRCSFIQNQTLLPPN